MVCLIFLKQRLFFCCHVYFFGDLMSDIYSSDGKISKKDLWGKYGRLVRYEALRIKARLPANVELDDLIQVGAISLLSAFDEYDVEKGVSLTTYITKRIRWSILDELRERDWVPRRVRNNNRNIVAAIREIEQATGSAADEKSIAKALGVSVNEYQQMLAETNTSQICSLEDLRELYPESIDVVDENTEKLNPVNELINTSLFKLVSSAIGFLPEREQLILNLYYQQDLNMKEIGSILNITETRVSQLHSQTIKRLRARVSSYSNG